MKPQAIKELVHHDIPKMEQEIGPLFKLMGPSPHTHEVNQLYCLLGDLELEVMLGVEKHRVKGPASILVPAGLQHAIRFAGGKGYLVNVLSGGRYR